MDAIQTHDRPELKFFQGFHNKQKIFIDSLDVFINNVSQLGLVAQLVSALHQFIQTVMNSNRVQRQLFFRLYLYSYLDIYMNAVKILIVQFKIMIIIIFSLSLFMDSYAPPILITQEQGDRLQQTNLHSVCQRSQMK